MKSRSILIFCLPLLWVTPLTFAESKPSPTHTHREQGSHVHGGGTLAIAFEGEKGRVEFKGAAESILGFEHQARSSQDKKQVLDATTHFEKDVAAMIQFVSELGCQFSKESIGQVPEKGHEGSGEHSDWEAHFNVVCKKSPVGSKVKIDFSSFKLLRDLDITILADSIQKSAEFKGKALVIDLN